ncbi:uncharacterized protein LOC125475429 [Pyrus x bretschneideri]|uniref:uncharacterized protein LOC125475429 n=1 Tax=Pyrus x bretschneideri TaxID=225117 RepID=UPI00202EA8A1|nr:uncharacterized protein LOC125475429 [Pyrus x bretschneideri]
MPLDLHCVESVKAHEDAVNALAVSNDGTMYTELTDCQIWVRSKPFGEDGSGVGSGLGGSGFEFREDGERMEERVKGRKFLCNIYELLHDPPSIDQGARFVRPRSVRVAVERVLLNGHGGRKRHWFCYTVRVLKEARAKSGYWRRQGRFRDVVGRGGKVVPGRRSSFVFYFGSSPNDAVRTDWVLYQYAQVDHVKAAFVLCRILVRSRSGNRISDHGLSSYAEESARTVRRIGIQHDGFHTPSCSENEVHGDTSVPRKNEMSKYPRLDPELDDRVMTRPVSIPRIQSNEQVPASVLGGRNPILLDNLAAKHLHSILEGDFIELDDLID